MQNPSKGSAQTKIEVRKLRLWNVRVQGLFFLRFQGPFPLFDFSSFREACRLSALLLDLLGRSPRTATRNHRKPEPLSTIPLQTSVNHTKPKSRNPAETLRSSAFRLWPQAGRLVHTAVGLKTRLCGVSGSRAFGALEQMGFCYALH